MSVADVRCDGVTVRRFICRSKTDQAGRWAHVDLFSIPGSAICLVAVVGKYLGLRPAVAGSFLVHADGAALSIFQFVSVLRRCLSAASIEASQSSSHSFRIGAATEAARWGLDNEVVKCIGRWESDRFKLCPPPFGLIEVVRRGEFVLWCVRNFPQH